MKKKSSAARPAVLGSFDVRSVVAATRGLVGEGVGRLNDVRDVPGPREK